MSSSEGLLIADIKARLRSRGWFVRYTEWPAGHQVVIHRRSDTSVHRVTQWHPSELEAWREALALAATSEDSEVRDVERDAPMAR